MNIDVIQLSKIHMISSLESGFNIPIDGAKEIGGQEKGARPMELFLSALAGCSGIDVLVILQKARADLKRFNIKIKAQRRDEIPKIFSSIHLLFQIEANCISEKQLYRAIQLSVDKYCSVRSMLKDEIKISYSLELKNFQDEKNESSKSNV